MDAPADTAAAPLVLREECPVEVPLENDQAAADWWGVSRRTVIRRRKDRTEAFPDGAPFETPSEMESWHRSNWPKKNLPSWLSGALERWRDGGGTPAKHASLAQDDQGFELNEDEALSYGGLIKAQEVLVVAFYKDLAAATKNRQGVERKHALYMAAAKELRQLKASRAKIMIAEGEAWRKEEVAEALRDIFSALNSQVDLMAVRLASEAGLTKDQGKLVRKICADMKKPMADCAFASHDGS